MWQNIKQRKFLFLFSLPFAGIGVGFLIMGIGATLWEYNAMKSWAEGQAYLVDAGVNIHTGDDSTTYSAYAQYHYQYQGDNYQGSRVAINSSADNIGDFQEEVGRALERAWRNNEPVSVWINPNNPEEAVLNRELRWGLMGFQLIFVLAFGGVGIGLMLFCLLKQPAELSNEMSTAASITENNTWKNRKAWQSNQVLSGAKTGMWAALIFSFFWNVISIPAAIFATPEIIAGNYAALLAYIFPVVGIGLIIWAVRATQNWRRYGRTPFTLDPFPGSIGGQVGGTLILPVPFHSDHSYTVTLSCVFSYMSGSGKNRSRKEKLIWQSQGFAHTKSEMNSTRIEVLFNVDDSLPPSDAKRGSRYHLWRLNISSNHTDVKFDRNFDIPVYPTNTSAKQLSALSTEHPQAEQYRLQEIESVLDIGRVPGGIQIYYPPFKKTLIKCIGIFCGLIFFGIGLLVGYEDGPMILAIAFTLVGGLIGLFSFYSLILGLHVIIDRQFLTSKRYLFHIPSGNRQIPRSDIKHLVLAKSFQQGSGSKMKTTYKIQAITTSGKKINIGYNLEGRNVAEQALESISMLSGIEMDLSAHK